VCGLAGALVCLKRLCSHRRALVPTPALAPRERSQSANKKARLARTGFLCIFSTGWVRAAQHSVFLFSAVECVELGDFAGNYFGAVCAEQQLGALVDGPVSEEVVVDGDLGPFPLGG